MKRKSLLAICACALIAVIVLTGKPVGARFMSVPEVPIERLLKNVGAYVRTHPKDPQGIYTLGRLHSLAFADGLQSKVLVVTKDRETQKPLPLPDFGPYSTPMVEPAPDLHKRRVKARVHLQQSLKLYRQALAMDAGNALYWLSYGWMLEQGSAFASEVDAPFQSKPGRAKRHFWREEAFRAYLKAFDLSQKKDAALDDIFIGRDVIVSQESGEYLLRLAKEMPDNLLPQARRDAIRVHIERLKEKPHAITPIIFPLHRPQSLDALLAPNKQVTFDLDGTRLHSRWPWVGRETGILVWDPNHTGKITSGLQLFGSLTWQMMWRNGYEPLAALDDDRNGWLEKSELKGLACWQDRNSNGKADPGEVVPLTSLGVVRLAVHPAGKQGKTLFHPSGIQFRNGMNVPSYDWMPVSLPE